MIQRLYVNNYKCLVNFELRLQELSLLLGPSGVGKTAVLDIMFALRRLLSGEARVMDADVFPTRTLTRWQNRDIQEFEIEVRLESDTFTYRLEVEHERASKRARISLDLQPWLMRLEDVCGDAVQQAVLTSHHPELIDYLGSESGVLLRRETSGLVTTRRPEVSAGPPDSSSPS